MWKKEAERAGCIPDLTKGRTEILFIVNTRKTKYVNIIIYFFLIIKFLLLVGNMVIIKKKKKML